MTLYEMFKKTADENGDLKACVYFGKSFLYRELLSCIDSLAGYFVKHVEDERVGVIMPNCPDMLIALYALNKSGKTVVFLNPKSPVNELKRALKLSGVKTLIACEIVYAKLATLIDDGVQLEVFGSSLKANLPLFFLPSVIKRSYNGKPLIKKALKKKGRNFLELSGLYRSKEKYEFTPVSNEEAVIIFSGGTGGSLKYIVHSSESIISSCLDCCKLLDDIPGNQSMLAVLPCFHIFGLIVGIVLPVTLKGYPVLYPFFHAPTIARLIAEDCPSYLCAVPTIFERIMDTHILEKREAAGRVNASGFVWGFCGGDIPNRKVLDYFNTFFERNNSKGFISVGYGMSECCPISVCEKGRFDDMYVGRIQSMTEVVIADDEGVELPDGESGEILIKSPYLMKRSLDEKGDEIITEEFYKTGDIGFKKGNELYYKTRKRRIIKTSGHSIFAGEIERILCEHELVGNAYVVPVSHAKRGFAPYAYIVPNSAVTDKEKLFSELSKLVRENMVAYGIPIGYKLVEEKDIKKNMLGKVVYGELEQKAE